MKITITIESSETENHELGGHEGECPHAIWHFVDDLDQGLSEAHGRIDELEALVAGQARPTEPAFDSDVDDQDL
jgi:hypothetical protein